MNFVFSSFSIDFVTGPELWMLEWKRLIYIWSLETGESLIGGVVITVLIVPTLAVQQT